LVDFTAETARSIQKFKVEVKLLKVHHFSGDRKLICVDIKESIIRKSLEGKGVKWSVERGTN